MASLLRVKALKITRLPKHLPISVSPRVETGSCPASLIDQVWSK